MGMNQRRLGKYELQEPLGSGAVGEIWSLELRGVGRSARYFESTINARERFSNLRRLHSSGEHRLPACSLRQLAANIFGPAIRGR